MSHEHSVDRLIYMANQIEKFFQANGHDAAIAGIADHIARFWDPRMRRKIYAHIDDEGGKGLDALTKEALETLRKKDPIAKQGSEAKASDGNVVDKPRRAKPSRN